MSDQYLGEIRMFGGNFAPFGWALCNGQLLAISSNAALFSLLGTFYGGNGTSTFGLPDLRGRVPIHQGQGLGLSPYVVGEQTGLQTASILLNNLPLHSHLVNCNSGTPGSNSPENHFIAAGATINDKLFQTTSNTTMAQTMIQPTGGSQPISILQPLLCVTFIIALTGIFPSRN
jgi:microcystin-dependent protein